MLKNILILIQATRLLTSTTRRSSIASYFDRSQTINRIGSLGGRSSSVSDISEAGDEDDQFLLTSSEAGDEICFSISPLWDPFALSNSQSSEAESIEHSSTIGSDTSTNIADHKATLNMPRSSKVSALDYSCTNGNREKVRFN